MRRPGPRLALSLLVLVVLGVAVAVALLWQREGPSVVYEAF